MVHIISTTTYTTNQSHSNNSPAMRYIACDLKLVFIGPHNTLNRRLMYQQPITSQYFICIAVNRMRFISSLYWPMQYVELSPDAPTTNHIAIFYLHCSRSHAIYSYSIIRHILLEKVSLFPGTHSIVIIFNIAYL